MVPWKMNFRSVTLYIVLLGAFIAASDDHADANDNTDHEDDSHHEAHVYPEFALAFLFMALTAGVFSARVLKHTGVPYTVLLLLLGSVIGLCDKHIFIHFDGYDGTILQESILQWSNINPHLVMYIFLPILIFESAYNCNTHVFYVEISQILILAVPGVIFCTVCTAYTIKLLFDIQDMNACLMMGAMLSATDPVAVVALMKELGTSIRLSTLIEGESLLNDGTSIVIFNVFKDALTGEEDRNSGEIAQYFFQLSLGGTLFGVLFGFLSVLCLAYIHNDAPTEITVTIIAAFGVFIVAEAYKTSGVLALVALGLFMSAYGRLRIEPQVEHVMGHFWELCGYLANTIVFVMSGVIVIERGISKEIELKDWFLLIALYVILHVIRTTMLFILAPVLGWLGYGMDRKTGVALAYGGLRGAVGLTLALIIEEDEDIGDIIRSKSMFLMSGIAFMTLLINGTSFGYVMHKIGLTYISEATEESFQNSCEEIDSETMQALYRITDANRFLAEVSNQSNLVQAVQYLAIHSQETYDKRIEQFKDFPWQPLPKLKRRWDKYHHQYRTEGQEENVTQTNPIAGEVTDVSDTPINQPSGNHQLRLEEMRSRFLKAVKTQIWVQVEEGFLDSRRAGVLLEVIEQQTDEGVSESLKCCELLIDIFKPSLSAIFSDTFNRFLNKKPFDKVSRSYVHAQLESLFDILCGFVLSCEKALTAVIGELGASDGSEVIDEFKKEVQLENTKFEQFADTYMKSQPSLMLAIKIKASARVMLCIQRKEIEHRHHLGLLDDREYDILIRANNVGTKKTLQHPLSANVLKKKQFIKGHPFIHRLAEQTILELSQAAKEKYYEQDKEILRENEESKSWIVIVSGTVRIVHKTEDGENVICENQGPNSMIGTLGLMTETARSASVIAHGCVRTYEWSGEASKKLMIIHPELALMMWQSVALFNSETFIPELRNIGKEKLVSLVMDSELWSHTAASHVGGDRNSRSGSSIFSSENLKSFSEQFSMGSDKNEKSNHEIENESMHLAHMGILLWGAVKRDDEWEWTSAVTLLPTGNYTCNASTTILELPLLHKDDQGNYTVSDSPVSEEEVFSRPKSKSTAGMHQVEQPTSEKLFRNSRLTQRFSVIQTPTVSFLETEDDDVVTTGDIEMNHAS